MWVVPFWSAEIIPDGVSGNDQCVWSVGDGFGVGVLILILGFWDWEIV